MEASNHSRIPGRFPGLAWLADLSLAILLTFVGFMIKPVPSSGTAQQWLYGLIVLGCGAALTFRRVWPRASLSLTAALLLVHLVALNDAIDVFAVAMCLVASYSTQTQLAPPWRWLYAAAVYLGAFAAVLTARFPSGANEQDDRIVVTGIVMAVLTVALLAGVVRRQSRTRYQEALARAVMAEARWEAERRLAVAEERARIAREMHDVLGHSLNAIAMQAEGVRHIVRTDPQRTDHVLATIGRLSRDAVDDVRGLIDVLTTEHSESPLHPTPRLADISSLIGDLHYTKAPIRLRIDGEIDDVPQAVGLAGYRIIQESLTNVLKHADGASVHVDVAVREGAVDLAIVNTAIPAPQRDAATGNPRGILGMQERARALGGRLVAGREPDTGGWRVAATLPWSRR